MKFATLFICFFLLLWGVCYYPLKHLSDPSHFYGFYLGSLVNFGCFVLNYTLLFFAEKQYPRSLGWMVLWGSLIRMTAILTTLILFSFIPKFNLITLALWTLFFYFFTLFWETYFLFKKFSTQTEE